MNGTLRESQTFFGRMTRVQRETKNETDFFDRFCGLRLCVGTNLVSIRYSGCNYAGAIKRPSILKRAATVTNGDIAGDAGTITGGTRSAIMAGGIGIITIGGDLDAGLFEKPPLGGFSFQCN